MSALPLAPTDRVAETQYRMDQLFRLWRTTTMLSTRDIARLNELLSKISPDDLKRAATFAEGLVEWAAGVSG